MKLRSEVAVYDFKAVASKFTAHDTQFNVVQGKINALVSESEITTLVSGGKTMYSRLAAAEMTVDSISTQVSDQVLGDGATSLKSRISTVEQTATSITSRVSAVETNGVTKTNLVSVINQKAGQISVKILKGADNNDTVQTLLKANADSVRLTTGNLSWKATNSEMTQDGTLKCKHAELTGKITASSGSIAGWTIGSTSISGTISGWTTSINKPTATTTNVFKVTDGSTTPFRVTAQGKLYATGAEISGKVSATSGAIGGWTLSSDGLHKTVGNYEVRLRASTGSTDAAIRVRDTSAGSTKFYVTNQGNLYAANANISGKITSTEGSIAGITIEKYRMKKDLGSYRMFIQGPRNDESYHTVGETWYFSAQKKKSSGGYYHTAFITGDGDIRGTSLYIDSKDKNRIIKMSDGKYRKLYCCESPAPYFMDCGKGKTGAKGALYADAGYAQVTLSKYFLECTSHNNNYFVFIQPLNGSGNFYVTNLKESFRVVGTPNTEFFWQAICLTSDNDNCYLDIWDEPEVQ